MDYASMIWTEPFALIVPKPENESRLFAFIRPFQAVVWLFLAFAATFFVAFMSTFSWIYKLEHMASLINVVGPESLEGSNGKNRKTKRYFPTSISYYAVYVINILTNHGSYTPYSKYSFRVLAGSWLLASLVLVNSYSSIVVSSLTVPTMKPAVNSFEELANSDEVSLIMLKNVVLGMQILSATSGTFKILGDQLRQHPDRLFLDFVSPMAKLDKGKYAFPWIRSFNRHLIVNKYKQDHKCRFQLSDPLPLSTGYFCAVLQKHSRYTASFSYGLNYLWETGLTRLWVQNITNFSAADKCFDKKKNTPNSSISQQVAIKLEDLLSAFFVFGAGIGLAWISFMCELFFGKIMRRRR